MTDGEELRPLSTRQAAELRGYVALGTRLFGLALFLAVLGCVGGLARGAQRLATGSTAPAYWLAVVALAGAVVYRVSGRWTGGSDFRRRVREDLAAGQVAVRRVDAVEAIRIEPQGDEGPTVFLRTADGRTVVFAGQYVERLHHFPWTSFEVRHSPRARVFFGLKKLGVPLRAAHGRALTWQESKELGILDGRGNTVDVPFDVLRERLSLGPDRVTQGTSLDA